jgi:dTDP-L-rhamnose 4-epimerase
MKKATLLKRRILLTGGAGFIGSHTAARLALDGHEVRVLDSLDPQIHGAGAAFPAILPPNVETLRADINDPKALATALDGIDAIGHFAALTGVGQSLYDITSYVGVNVSGTAALLEGIVRGGPPYPAFLLASSRAVYGEGAARCPRHGIVAPGPRERVRLEAGDLLPRCPCGARATPVPTREGHPLSPVSMYGWTKQAQEEICRQAARVFGLPVTVLRYFNVYGSKQSLINPYTGIVSGFYNRLRAKRPISLFEAGRPTRDFVHVSDVARANVFVLTRPVPMTGTYNIGSGEVTSIRHLAETLASVMSIEALLEDKGEFRSGDIFSGVADNRSAQNSWGYAPKVTLKKGLREFVSWAASQDAEDRQDRATEELRQRGLFVSGVKWKK